MNSLKTKYITALGLVSSIALSAQESVKEVALDSSSIDITPFKEGLSERYSGNDFNYSINDTGGVNLVQQVLRKFFGWLRDLFGIDISYINYKTLEYIIYGLLGCGVLYLLIKFLLENPVSSVFKTENKTIDGFNYIEENIETIDFDTLISNALKENNFRLATRYMYLKSLKALSAKGVIEWHFDKTNNDYLREIKDNQVKSLFKRASYIYDYVWYGEFPINETDFNQNKNDFNQLIKLKSNG
ncbi:hypothetical protein [Winogradskyella haliclonae]|uniref:DUF4129 domain-containing protein n=1 Tax=Winogradskyella haliclonae TaxID=2048558 RepID=A0ABQ2BXK3_9FLAO|nr:hypothetical protein [Winogradskyella haliclonae]GGI57205.1 hypothetical protein GCM10011444_15140 [Winogradskyella haliclonae]